MDELIFKNNTSSSKPNIILVKAKLYHLDGQQSEMFLVIPKMPYTEPYEVAAMQLKEYINKLTCYWIEIEKFDIQIGKLVDGEFVPFSSYATSNIPLNKVFKEGKKGEWVTEEEAIKREYQY